MEKKKGVVNLIVASVALALSIIMLASSIFAWLTYTREVSSSGISFETSTKTMQISDQITIVRTLTSSSDSNVVTSIYRKDASDGEYYEYNTETNDWVYETSGEKRTVSIRGLLPNESIDFILPITRSNAESDLNYSVSILDLHSEMFYHDYMVGETSYHDVHSMLEVIRLSWLEENEDGVYVETSATPDWLLTYGSTDADGSHYITDDGVEYEILENVGTGDEAYDYIQLNSFSITSGVWPSEQETLVIAFRLTFDTAQISGLALTNALSLKRLSIAQIRIVAG